MRIRVSILVALLAAGCPGQTQRAEPAAPERTAPAPSQVDDSVSLAKLTEEPPEEMYALDEAVADALSGPLTFIGKGPWHGIYRIAACAYRNERVIVVNVYCTKREMSSFRVDVFSPTRGRARIYAEGDKPISTLTRADYFTFVGEVQPAPPANAGLPLFDLEMSWEELQRYEQHRYEKFLPACYGGVEIHNPQGGCLGDLASLASEFASRNGPFLKAPPDDWYRLVKMLRDARRKP